MLPLAIKDIPFFHDLSPKELNLVQDCLTEKSFDKGEIIHSEGTDCTRLFFVQSGRVKIYRMASSGREQILEMLAPGDTCACNPGNASWYCTSTAEAVIPSRVWFLSRERYIQMVQKNSKLTQALNQLFAKRLQCFSNIIEEVSLKDSKKRLIKFLLDMLEERQKSAVHKDILYITSTREEISQRLGTARETVARHISDLKRKKLIDVKPHQIIIRNKEGLEKLLA